LGIALILATLFTVWTPENLFTNQWMDRMFQSWQTSGTVAAPLVATQPSNGQPRIGIVSGHSGNDSGAVCDPPLDKRFTEAQINSLIANKVVANLKSQGYQVDLLKEFDPRLTQYRALALVSIHTDSCKYINNEATGFKVAAAKNSVNTNLANRLSDCLWNRYQKDTGLKPHYGSVTTDMTDYHAFNEINSDTTAAIIEIGFMNLDYDTIMNNPDKIAQGITDGIICFARNEDVGNPAPTATPGQ
jgi:N-acetylmuramoyl-L-alanine amidase